MRHVRQTMENGLRVVAFSLLTAGLTTACHDKDDPKPEVVSTPDATTEYYILGTVQNAGKAQANIQVNAAGKELTTDAKGEFQVTLTQTGTFAIRVEQAKYLPIKTEVVIPQGAENRTAVKIVLPLTEKSEPTLVDPSQIEEGKPAKVEDTSNSNRDVPDQEQDMGITAPDQVNESTPIAKMSIEIPKGALEESQEISVTTYVPIPTVTNTVPKNEEGKEVEKSTPLAAAHFLPDGLQFKTGVQISIPNPLPGVELAEEEMELKYLDPKTNQWVDPEKKENVTTSQATYTTKVHHFSAYAINVKTKVNASAETVDNSVSLGSKKVDNSNELKATRDVTLTYKEKTGWEYDSKDIAGDVEKQLPDANTKTINAIVELMKKQMYQQMGSTSGVTETERTYNKVNVSGYTLMTYNCYPKVRTITVTLSVKQGSQNINISVKAKRYTGAKNEYTVKQFGPEHSGGGGANN